jgi:hypothetical protein
MNHKRIPNLGSKGWFLVVILVLMPIVSIYATSGDTKTKAGVTVRDIGIHRELTSRHHTISTLIKRDEQLFLEKGHTPDIKLEPYFLVEAGASEYFPDTEDYYISNQEADLRYDSKASINIYGFYWNEKSEKMESDCIYTQAIGFLPKQILYDSRLLAVTGKNRDRWDINISEFRPGELFPREIRRIIAGEGDLRTISLNDGILTVIFNKDHLTSTEVKLDVDKLSPNDILITPRGTLTIFSMMAKEKQINDTCKLTLRALGSTQMAYQELNSHSDFGTYLALENTGFIEKGYTRKRGQRLLWHVITYDLNNTS